MDGNDAEALAVKASEGSPLGDRERLNRLYEIILSTTDDFAYIFDPQGRFLYANTRLLKVWAKTLDQVVGKTCYDLGYPTWHADMHTREIEEVVRTKAAIRGEVPFTGDSGIFGVYDYIFQPVLDAAGNVEVIVGTTRDVTDRKQAEERLAEALMEKSISEQRYRFLAQLTQKLSHVSSSAELNRIATREIGHFLRAHRCYFFDAYPDIHHARVLTDWCRDEEPSIVGVYMLEEFGQPEWWTAVRHGPVSVSDISGHELTKDFLPKYQALKIAAYTLSPFIHEGKWTACISVTSDRPRVWTENEKTLLEDVVARVWPLLERAKIEEQLEQLVAERTASLREAVSQMEEFSYSVSHDLRAPLRAMQGYAAVLLEDYRGKPLDAEAEDFLQRIVSAGARMDRLTRDVLVYSKIPRTSLQLHEVALDKLVSDIAQQYRQEKAHPAEIDIEAPLPSVMGNESFLAQAISNLVDNAVKFMPPNRMPKIKIRAESIQGQVRLWVEDNGIGIKPEHQKRIWGMFERVHPETKFAGTGIGLAIVRKTIERMNGTMGVDSDGVAGSRFWIQLPGV